jgi:hypothetical protein
MRVYCRRKGGKKILALVDILDKARVSFSAKIDEMGLGEEDVLITVASLTVQEAIGNPKREDYPLLKGKEVMIEARFRNGFGQAFTDEPGGFRGPLKAVFDLNLDTKNNRAIFIAALNAVLAHLGTVEKTRHCRDEEPEECAGKIADHLLARFGKIKVGLIGYQPAILAALVKGFGASNLRCTDLNPKNTGAVKNGVTIEDASIANQEITGWADLLLVTSSTMVNNTFDEINKNALSHGKHLITFGVSGAGISALTGVERVCFCAH